ncbi:hypothetical protein [Maribellus sp. YY47]|uniref:hypothetical protein n=1 Tax=Maribellus sp. YY47 TaxID=2929486 RepID=UPI00200187B8|nr:hypothetical protein [Maribellus sp. YY47]MCK3684640.1 hypothetical protein [Maribellus sp. YY47]
MIQKTMLMLAFSWFVFTDFVDAQIPKYQVKVVTCVESLVPDGLGRSRMFETDMEVKYLDFTSTQTEEKGDRNKSNRKDIRVKDYEETKLLNLYNEGGIRFQNVATNDALMMSKINEMLEQGWELFFVGAGVESKMINVSVKKELLKAGLKVLLNDDSKEEENKNDPNGLFMTRYYFKKKAEQLSQ